MKTICSNCQTENNINSKYCSVCGYKLTIIETENISSKDENLKNVKPKNKFDLKTIAGFVFGFVVMFYVTQSLLKPSIDEELAKVASELNKTCPMNVDESTMLKNAVALPNKTLQYNYLLIGITKSEVKIDTMRKYFFPGILESVKSSPAMKGFRERKVTFNYYYMDKNGEFVMEYKIKPEMYQ